jgi:hypothetical protein
LETHTKRFLIAFTERQHETLQKAAEDCGRSMSDFARDVIMSFIESGKRLPNKLEKRNMVELIPEVKV